MNFLHAIAESDVMFVDMFWARVGAPASLVQAKIHPPMCATCRPAARWNLCPAISLTRSSPLQPIPTSFTAPLSR